MSIARFNRNLYVRVALPVAKREKASIYEKHQRSCLRGRVYGSEIEENIKAAASSGRVWRGVPWLGKRWPSKRKWRCGAPKAGTAKSKARPVEIIKAASMTAAGGLGA